MADHNTGGFQVTLPHTDTLHNYLENKTSTIQLSMEVLKEVKSMQVTLTTRGEKFADYCSTHKLDYDRLLELSVQDSLCPGICTAAGCDFTCEEIESDQEFGYCESCGNQTVVSVLVIAGII